MGIDQKALTEAIQSSLAIELPPDASPLLHERLRVCHALIGDRENLARAEHSVKHAGSAGMRRHYQGEVDVLRARVEEAGDRLLQLCAACGEAE